MSDQEKLDKDFNDHATMLLLAGYLRGLSSTDRYELDEDDRQYLKQASEHLRKAVPTDESGNIL